jgi:hypothetical protein
MVGTRPAEIAGGPRRRALRGSPIALAFGAADVTVAAETIALASRSFLHPAQAMA